MSCNPQSTSRVTELLAQPYDARDAAWQEEFFSLIIDAAFTARARPITIGPDGFPYFGLLTPDAGQPFDLYCLSSLVERATEEGFGIAINPRGEDADYVFTFGDLMTLRMFGRVKAAEWGQAQSTEVLQTPEQVLVGAPSMEFLPSYARKQLHQHFESHGVPQPGAFLMNRPSATPPEQLVFSAKPEQFASEEAFRSCLRRATWYLPRHYAVIAIPNADQISRFYPLLDNAAPQAQKN